MLLITRNAEKRALAETLGATATIDPSGGNVVQRVTSNTGALPGGADVVFECAGIKETVEQAPFLARRGGTAVILGVLPSGEKTMIEPFDLLFREVALLASFINPFTHGRAAQLIASGTIKVDPLISRNVGLEEAAHLISNPAANGEIRTLVVPDSLA